MSERLYEYFASEASEYLDQLEALLGERKSPDLDQLLRLTRGVRGSAQMAGADTLVGVAERLEEGLRSVQAGQVVWSDDVRRLSAQTVDDLKLLVRASSRWSAIDDARVRAAIARWDDVDAGHPSQHSSSHPAEVPIESLFYDDKGPHVLSSEEDTEMKDERAAAGSQPVAIESLLLDREGALREALSMRDQVERSLRGIPGAEGELGATVRDLFELIELAAGGRAAGE